jgi:isochorismate synthase
MIDWTQVAQALTQLATQAQPTHLLSVTLTLPRWPETSLPKIGDWCFWQRPDHGLRLLGYGHAWLSQSAGSGRFAALHAAQRGLAASWRYCGERPRALVGFAFADTAHRDNEMLPNAKLWVPELLLSEQQGRTQLTLSCPASQAQAAPPHWRAHWQGLTKTPTVPPAPTFSAAPNPLAEQAFLSRGRAALAAITAGTVDKLVLTRAWRMTCPASCSPDVLLATLATQHPSCAIFGVGQNDRSFIGASPETLLTLQGEQVAVDALAGTAWQAKVLDTDKNRREHDFVARAIVTALTPHCHEIALPSVPEVMTLNTLSHLRRRVTARRAAAVGAFDLIARLHPTPAVGGAPTPAALDWLARHSDTRGAWYTGGIGWIDAAGDCDIAVALRCGLFEPGVATLYAGAGFVAGSDPAQEFAETEAKLAALRGALHAKPETEPATGSRREQAVA